jgi:hypothetical protein
MLLLAKTPLIWNIAPNNPYPGQRQEPFLIDDGDDDDGPHEEWQVLEVVDCRKTKRLGIQYKATYVVCRGVYV